MSDAQLIAISVMDMDGKLRIDEFCMALEWCEKNAVDGISISIGTHNWLDMQKMLSAIEVLSHVGIKIVAAGANSGMLTYPASLPEVYGVRFRERLHGIQRIECPWDGIDVEVGFEEPLILGYFREKYQFQQKLTNSMAAPWLLGQLLTNSIDINQNEVVGTDSLNTSISSDELETPVIEVKGVSRRVEELLEELRRNGYQAMLAGQGRKTDVKKGFLYLDKERIQEYVVCYLNNVKMDILLLEGTQPECLDKYVDQKIELMDGKNVEQIVSEIELFYT